MKLLVTLPLIASIICFQASAIADDTDTTNEINNQYMFILKSQPNSYETPESLNHYAKYMDNFMQKKFQGQTTVIESMFNEAFNEGDSEYLAQLPFNTRTAFDLCCPFNQRIIFCMNRYTD